MLKRVFMIVPVIIIILLFVTESQKANMPVFKANFSDAEARAESFVKEIYKNGIVFKTDIGDGTVYKKRYYCENVCIDVLSDGNIRYLSDVNDADKTDPLLRWFDAKKAKIVSESEFYGFLKRNVKTNEIRAELCIDKFDGRVVCARILFNS